MSQVIQRLTEAGLVRKWVDDEMDAVHLLSKTSWRPLLEPFTVDQLQAWLIYRVTHQVVQNLPLTLM